MSFGKGVKILIGILVNIQEYKNNHVIWAAHTQVDWKGKMSIKVKKNYCQSTCLVHGGLYVFEKQLLEDLLFYIIFFPILGYLLSSEVSIT